MGLVGFIVCSCRIDQENVSFFYFVEKFVEKSEKNKLRYQLSISLLNYNQLLA